MLSRHNCISGDTPGWAEQVGALIITWDLRQRPPCLIKGHELSVTGRKEYLRFVSEAALPGCWEGPGPVAVCPPGSCRRDRPHGAGGPTPSLGWTDEQRHAAASHQTRSCLHWRLKENRGRWGLAGPEEHAGYFRKDSAAQSKELRAHLLVGFK